MASTSTGEGDDGGESDVNIAVVGDGGDGSGGVDVVICVSVIDVVEDENDSICCSLTGISKVEGGRRGGRRRDCCIVEGVVAAAAVVAVVVVVVVDAVWLVFQSYNKIMYVYHCMYM